MTETVLEGVSQSGRAEHSVVDRFSLTILEILLDLSAANKSNLALKGDKYSSVSSG